MATNVHSQLTGDEIHTPYIKTFANESARNLDASTSTYTTADLYKKALQIDTKAEYILTAVTPSTVWTAVADVSSIVISDGGTIGGIYQSSVLCLGDVTMDDDVDVKGNLIVNGALENSDGHALIVYGDLGVRNSMNFNRTDITLQQSGITVWGNMVCKRILFKQSGDNAVELFVNGNLTSESTLGIDMSGEDDTGCTAGGSITVGGDLKAYSIDLSGGTNSAGAAKNGGTITVKGDFNIVNSVDVSGGEGGTYAGGSGGTVNVDGSLTCLTLNCIGGSSTGASAGNGGGTTVGGDLVIKELDGYGGACSSATGIHSAGLGGDLEVKGNIICETSIVLNGGDRTGTITTSGSGTPPSSGDITCYGNLVAKHIRLIGGNTNADLETSAAGDGGSLTVNGSLILRGPFSSNISGGNSAAGNGGNGGVLTAQGFCRLQELFSDGGNAVTGKDNGSAGSCSFYSGVSCEVGLSMLDGSGTGDPPTANVRLALAGHCSFNYLDVADRTEAWIYAPGNPATLQLIQMPTKLTLNDKSGTPTPDISSELAGYCYITGSSSGTWYKISGTSV